MAYLEFEDGLGFRQQQSAGKLMEQKTIGDKLHLLCSALRSVEHPLFTSPCTTS